MSQHGTTLNEYSDGQIAFANSVIANSLPLALRRFDRVDLCFALATQGSRLPQAMEAALQRFLEGNMGIKCFPRVDFPLWGSNPRLQAAL